MHHWTSLLLALSLGCAGARPAPPDPASAPDPACASQACDGVGQCDAVLGSHLWFWNGSRCDHFYAAGCSLEGRDCARLFEDEASCLAAHAGCQSASPQTRGVVRFRE
jgi:hypothetical protein